MKNSLRICTLILATSVTSSFGQDAAEMARKLQDPLANIKALMTDNDILFNTGEDSVSYSFQLQPVYAIPFEEQGFNLVLRGIVPIMGMAPESQRPILGEPLPASGGHTWGLGDIVLQSLFSPRSDSAWKWGAGPMASLETRTNSRLAGPGWGAGPVGVLVGNLTPEISTAFIAGHLWGQQDGFSTTIFQPQVFYNIPSMPGTTINYANVIAYDWTASSGNAWTVPLGLGVSKTIALDDKGTGLDLMLGVYHNVVKPKGAADWSLKFQISILFP